MPFTDRGRVYREKGSYLFWFVRFARQLASLVSPIVCLGIVGDRCPEGH